MKRAQLILQNALMLGLGPVFALGLGLGSTGCQESPGSSGDSDGASSGSDSKKDDSKPDSSKTKGSDDTSSSKPDSGSTKGSDTGSTQPEPNGEALTPTTYCEAFAKVVCEGDANCCKDSAKKFDSAELCQAQLESECKKDILVLVNDPRTGFDGDEATKQLTRLKSLVGSCDLKTAEWFAGKEGLMAMYAGTVNQGDSCTPKDADDAGAMLSCKDGYCLLNPFPLSGTCKATGRAKGDTYFAHVECTSGLYCTAKKGGTGKCETPVAEGGSCSDGFACQSLYCESDKCVARTQDRVYCAKK